jgi:hypothetical protein
MTTQIYLIEPPYTSKDPVADRNALGRAIGAAAAQQCVAVWFHEFEHNVAGFPCLLLECRESFMDTVRALPGYGRDKVRDDCLFTARSPELQAFFMNRPASIPTLRP